MNIAIWLAAGGLIGYMHFKANEEQGRVASILIGMVGGFFGGHVLAPMLGVATETVNGFNLFPLVVALATGSAFLSIGNFFSKRLGA